MTLEELQYEAHELAEEMRKVNIRSFGLKPFIHDDWCKRARRIADGLKDLGSLAIGGSIEDIEEHLSTKNIPPPPPVKAASSA